MTVEVSLDRLALIIDFDNVPSDVQLDIREVTTTLTDCFISNATDEETVIPEWHYNAVEYVKLSLGGDETDLFWHKREPMLNASLVSTQNSFLRMDFNPKRFRNDFRWLNALLEGLEALKDKMPYRMHVSQADFAFTMVGEQGAANMWLWKLGASQTKIMYSRSLAVATKYSGKRSSDMYAKLYDKRQERLDEIVNRYRTEKIRQKNLAERGLYEITEYEGQVVPILDNEKNAEIDQVPFNYWRFEVTMRTALFEDDSVFNRDAVVDRFLGKLEVRDLESISDPVVRAVALAVADDKVIKNELPEVLRKQYSAIMKWPDISGYYSNRHYRVVPTAELPDNEINPYRITRTQNDELSNKLIDEWWRSVDSLQSEIDLYIV